MRAIPAFLCMAVAGPAAASAQELAWTGSLQYMSGSYIFTETTHTYSLQSGLSLAAGRFLLSGSLPLILQNSSAITVVGGGVLPTGGTDHGAVGGRQAGQQVPMGHGGPRRSFVEPEAAFSGGGTSLEASLAQDSVVEEPGAYRLTAGDPFLSTGVELYRGRGAVRSVELAASLKIPFNDLDSGVGTGEWDYAVGGSASLAVGPALVLADLAWWWYGDLPGLELKDGLSVGGGLGVPLSRSVWVSAMATQTNRIIATAEAARSISLGLGLRTAGGASWSFVAGSGLSETAAGVVLSIGWRRALLGS